jgi:hypothetical protein
VRRRRIILGPAASGVLAVGVVAVRLFWAAFAPTPPVPDDVARLNFGMTEDEVIGTLGRRPDGEWDRVTEDGESRVEYPDDTQFPPLGSTVRYLEWESEGELITMRFYEGRVVNKAATYRQPKGPWRRAVPWLRTY